MKVVRKRGEGKRRHMLGVEREGIREAEMMDGEAVNFEVPVKTER